MSGSDDDGARAPGPVRARDVDFRSRPEHRWPVLVALAVAVTLYAVLPSQLAGPLRWIVVVVGVLCAVPLIVTSPIRLDRETRVGRAFAIVLVATLLLANQVALIALVAQLLSGKGSGAVLLIGAAQVWAVNAIAYAALFWEMDRGGPVARRRDPRDQLPAADFLFPQDDTADDVIEVAKSSSKKDDWVPGFVDYLYFSVSNAMAFSPTDVMPLTSRAKLIMMAQAVSGFALLALVIARSVNILS